MSNHELPATRPGTLAPALTRRGFLAAGGGLALTAGLSACGSPLATNLTGAQPDTADVIFWHLFSGGDGANLTTMVQDVRRSTGLSVEPTLLSWGNPYYTKLALSASSGRPPDVAVAHLSRLPLLARAGLLSPVGEAFAGAGVTRDAFTPAAWDKATVDGTTYAIPLDTHPFVLYYNLDLARQAGLTTQRDGAETLVAIEDAQGFVDAVKAMKQAGGGEFGAIATVTADPSTCWRLFLMTYSGLAGPVVSDGGSTVTVDDEAMEQTFAFLQSLTGSERLMPQVATATTTSSLFSQGKVGFLFDGVWQIPTYRGVEVGGAPLAFDVVPFPALLGPDPVAYADSHSLVIPASTARTADRTADAVTFIKGLLEQSATWADGGHVPAWLPVQQSAEFAALKPQSNYTEAAFNAIYDPPAWYTGAGSDFQTATGSVVADVLSGGLDPRAGRQAMTAALRTFSTARRPV